MMKQVFANKSSLELYLEKKYNLPRYKIVREAYKKSRIESTILIHA